MTEVVRLVGLCRSEIYNRIALGRFPRPVPLGTRVRGWDSTDIERWIAERIADRDADPRSLQATPDVAGSNDCVRAVS